MYTLSVSIFAHTYVRNKSVHRLLLTTLTKFNIQIRLPTRLWVNFYLFLIPSVFYFLKVILPHLLSKTNFFKSPTVLVSRLTCWRTRFLQVRYSKFLIQRIVKVASDDGLARLVRSSTSDMILFNEWQKDFFSFLDFSLAFQNLPRHHLLAESEILVGFWYKVVSSPLERLK